MEDVSLKTLATLVIGSLLFSTFLWAFLYIITVQKFGAVFKMFEALATGIAGQHKEIAENQITTFKNMNEQHKTLEISIKGEKEVFNENDYH